MTKETDKAKETTWYLYMVEDERSRLYTGISTDVERRFREHCDTYNGVAGAKGAKFFRSSQPLRVVYREACGNRAEASRRERALKALSSRKKRQLIAGTPVQEI
ncbi:MAG: GIY-YIG nuclease family protein [Ketobacteraceae bacterium]|nr:GIY-YIG nuclease family protein [Ketobacteraceae bacterium]